MKPLQLIRKSGTRRWIQGYPVFKCSHLTRMKGYWGSSSNNDRLATCPILLGCSQFFCHMMAWHRNAFGITGLSWGNRQLPMVSPHKGPAMGNFDVSWMLVELTVIWNAMTLIRCHWNTRTSFLLVFQVALKPLVEIALGISQLRELTGRQAPTVIT